MAAYVAILILAIVIILCNGNDICKEDGCIDPLDIPLIDKLNAPLKAELDISKLNEQLKMIISKEVERKVDTAVKNVLDNVVDSRLLLAEENLRTENNRKLSLMLEDLKEQTNVVSFFAYLSTNWKQLTTHNTLIYDIVDLNIGNAYNKDNGIFTAPSSGLYLFHVSTGAYDFTYASIQLVLNGQVKNIGFADSGQHNDRTFVTTVTPLQIEKDDIVSTRIGVAHSPPAARRYKESNKYIRTSFSGVKIN